MDVHVGMTLFRIVMVAGHYELQSRLIARVTDKHFSLDSPFGGCNGTYLQKREAIGRLLFLTARDAIQSFACSQRNAIAQADRRKQVALAAIDWVSSIESQD